MHEPDKLLETEVREELLWDPHLDDKRVVVRAGNGRVTLSGWVPSHEQEVVAVDDTWAMNGVREVDDELLVGGAAAPMADAELAEACRRALRAERLVPDGAVNVAVAAGRATLSGEVRRPYQRVAAERAVRGVKGILGLTSHVVLTDDPVPSEVLHRVVKALRRQSLVDASPVQVTNQAHTVFLDGTVKSERARQIAGRAASTAPGVKEVVNRLSVEPPPPVTPR
jgi:osmotically-inducible protein OsmY